MWISLFSELRGAGWLAVAPFGLSTLGVTFAFATLII